MSNPKNVRTLDERLKELEELVDSLEKNNLTIDEAISKYAEGMKLAVTCRKSLNELTQKIAQVRQDANEQMSQLGDPSALIAGVSATAERDHADDFADEDESAAADGVFLEEDDEEDDDDER